MGIKKTARDDIAAIVAAFKSANAPNRAKRRQYYAELSNAINELMNKHDAQDNAAANDFAASRPGQFSTFVDGLPDVALDPVDPQA